MEDQEEKKLLPLLPDLGKIASKIVVIISAIIFWVIGLNSQLSNFRDFFYIPFLLLFLGFFLGLISYNGSRDDRGKFAMGIIGLVFAYNFLWNMIYWYIAPLSGPIEMGYFIIMVLPPLFALTLGTVVYLIY
jgi:hypothetical protein